MIKHPKITGFLAIVLFIALNVATSIIAAPGASAACTDGNGYFWVNGGQTVNGVNVQVYSNWSQIAGTGAWSIGTACSYSGRGIMFIVGSPTIEGSLYGGWTFNANAYVGNTAEGGYSTLYMGGMIHNPSGSPKKAYNVGICDEWNKDTCINNSNPYSGQGTHISSGAISLGCSSFTRSSSGGLNLYSGWTNPGESETCPLYFDIAKLAQAIQQGSISYEDKGNGVGVATIYNFRCQIQNYSDSCGGSAMKFIFMTNILNNETSYTGSVTPKIGSTTYSSGDSVEVTSARTKVDFVDSVTRSNDGGTFATRICYYGSGASGTRYTKCDANYSAGGTNTQKTTSTYVTLDRGESVRVCHTLNYPQKSKTDNTGTDYTTTEACITITRSGGTSSNDCVSNMDSTFNMTNYVGKTDAWMYVKKNEESQVLKGSGSATYWAKPSDNIQFEYKMCGGSEHSRTADNDEPARYFSSADVNPKFTISAKKKTATDTNYLFGMSPTSFTSGTDIKYYKGLTSPSTNNYTCAYTNGTTHKTNFYQIPGEAGNTCTSAAVARYSDVGSYFSQSIAYRYVTTERYSVYHPDTCTDAEGNSYDCSYYTYGTQRDSASNKTLTGTVYVPYNYALVPYVKHTSSNGITYAGAKLNTEAFVATIGRINKDVQDGKYATHSKPTTIRVVSFTTTNTPSSDIKFINNNNMTDTEICRQAGGTGNCTSLLVKSSQVLNQTTDQLNGAADETASITNGGSNVNSVISADVPLADPGVKFCVAVGVYPADSHNTGDNSQINKNDYRQSNALSTSGTGWKVSMPACVTIAKKPNFSVESSNLVTNGKIETSTSGANNRLFGSWSEYGITAKGSVSNMGSGAAYAYTTPYNSFTPNGASSNAGLPKSATNKCIHSQQTIGNASCSLGNATVVNNSTDLMAVAKKMHELYYMTSSDMNEGYQLKYGVRDIAKVTRYFNRPNNRVNISGKSYVNFYSGSESACRYDAESGRYIAPSAYSSTYPNAFAIDEHGNRVSTVYCTADGNKYMKVGGDAYYGGTPTINYGGSGTSDLDHEHGVARTTYRNPVYVLDVEGTLIIDSNIHINNGGSDRFQAIDQIPTIIIFAKEVIISDNVDRLDAWIIAGLDGGSGKVNTCGYSHSANALIATADLTSNKCNKALYINGPVYASSVVLNRTYGGGSNSTDKFVQRAEVFNLRSDAYYWAYYQSQRNRILTTVYSRELPTRY